MAINNSTTLTRAELTDNHSVIAQDLTTLLELPLGAEHDLFQILAICQIYADELTETNNHAECLALCGRLLAGLNMLKAVLKAPLPEHLIELLTVEAGDTEEYRSLLTTDSETVREYCGALTMVLLNQQAPADQREYIIGLLGELLAMLAEDLKTPRFIRTSDGLAMLDGEAVPGIH
ncbi:hypothetical protein MUA03_09710 [Enterobacteriaceae bacterium H16N7]|nr:hypothetical protein [Dryocola clanedunensis]